MYKDNFSFVNEKENHRRVHFDITVMLQHIIILITIRGNADIQWFAFNFNTVLTQNSCFSSIGRYFTVKPAMMTLLIPKG